MARVYHVHLCFNGGVFHGGEKGVRAYTWILIGFRSGPPGWRDSSPHQVGREASLTTPPPGSLGVGASLGEAKYASNLSRKRNNPIDYK